MLLNEQFGGPSRVCANCSAEVQLPSHLQTPRGPDVLSGSGSGIGSRKRGPGDEDDGIGGPDGPLSNVSSRASELNECPVCGKTLANLGDATRQEEHVRACLDNGGGGSVQSGRYLGELFECELLTSANLTFLFCALPVYKLPDNSPIIGKECAICMEDFEVDSTIARLPCLCFFHRNW